MKTIYQNRTKMTIGTLMLTSLFVLMEHLKGGVVSHHLLAREDLPAISNWWGLLTVPLLTWLVLTWVNRRESGTSPSNKYFKRDSHKTGTRLLSGLIFGVCVSLLWELRLEEVLQFFILAPFLIAIFRPIYFSEYLLGFVIGMIFTFGGILPIMIGLVLLIVCFVLNKLTNLIKGIVLSKSGSSN